MIATSIIGTTANVSSRTHFPKTPLREARDRAASLGLLLSDASRSFVSKPRSFSVVGLPKISVIAFAAVQPTA